MKLFNLRPSQHQTPPPPSAHPRPAAPFGLCASTTSRPLLPLRIHDQPPSAPSACFAIHPLLCVFPALYLHVLAAGEWFTTRVLWKRKKFNMPALNVMLAILRMCLNFLYAGHAQVCDQKPQQPCHSSIKSIYSIQQEPLGAHGVNLSSGIDVIATVLQGETAPPFVPVEKPAFTWPAMALVLKEELHSHTTGSQNEPITKLISGR
ncbi:hypothetical protein SESBI_47393 [Sesbania bispinosa]|nr:hypothetical protein SESBI_47393 [Sesbania bispinosa]